MTETATIINGQGIAARLLDNLAVDISALKQNGIVPGLAVVLVGDDPASQVYVRNKIATCERIGIKSYHRHLPAVASQDNVLALIDELNADPDIHGILLQMPLPAHINPDILISHIHPAKDVDGLHPVNLGALMSGIDGGMVPCTPLGALHLIRSVTADLTGMHAVVIGRSVLFGKPMGQLLLHENCTVTQAHSKTRDLPQLAATADILVVATGQAHMVKADWVKPGAIVIDVGISRTTDSEGRQKLIGDVDFDGVQKKVRAITPVPGGVGPMTIAYLMKNTVRAARFLSAP